LVAGRLASTNKLCVAECGYHLFASLSCLSVREVAEGYYWSSVPIADVETAASETIIVGALHLFNGPLRRLVGAMRIGFGAR